MLPPKLKSAQASIERDVDAGAPGSERGEHSAPNEAPHNGLASSDGILLHVELLAMPRAPP